MQFKKLKSNKKINVNILKYKVDWDHKVSAPQLKVKEFLFPYWKDNTVLEEFIIPGSLLRLDLININQSIVIEVSPERTHTRYNKFMHGSLTGYLRVIKADLEKEKWAKDHFKHVVTLIDEDIENLSIKLFREKFKIEL